MTVSTSLTLASIAVVSLTQASAMLDAARRDDDVNAGGSFHLHGAGRLTLESGYWVSEEGAEQRLNLDSLTPASLADAINAHADDFRISGGIPSKRLAATGVWFDKTARQFVLDRSVWFRTIDGAKSYGIANRQQAI